MTLPNFAAPDSIEVPQVIRDWLRKVAFLELTLNGGNADDADFTRADLAAALLDRDTCLLLAGFLNGDPLPPELDDLPFSLKKIFESSADIEMNRRLENGDKAFDLSSVSEDGLLDAGVAAFLQRAEPLGAEFFLKASEVVYQLKPYLTGPDGAALLKEFATQLQQEKAKLAAQASTATGSTVQPVTNWQASATTSPEALATDEIASIIESITSMAGPEDYSSLALAADGTTTATTPTTLLTLVRKSTAPATANGTPTDTPAPTSLSIARRDLSEAGVAAIGVAGAIVGVVLLGCLFYLVARLRNRHAERHEARHSTLKFLGAKFYESTGHTVMPGFFDQDVKEPLLPVVIEKTKMLKASTYTLVGRKRYDQITVNVDGRSYDVLAAASYKADEEAKVMVKVRNVVLRGLGKVDSSFDLYLAADGQWKARLDKEIKVSNEWLPADTFSELGALGRQRQAEGSVITVGGLDICYAPIKGHSKDFDASKMRLVERRAQGNRGVRYHILNADLKLGHEVILCPADGHSAADTLDPFTDEAYQYFDRKQAGGAAPGLGAGEMTAVEVGQAKIIAKCALDGGLNLAVTKRLTEAAIVKLRPSPLPSPPTPTELAVAGAIVAGGFQENLDESLILEAVAASFGHNTLDAHINTAKALYAQAAKDHPDLDRLDQGPIAAGIQVGVVQLMTKELQRDERNPELPADEQPNAAYQRALAQADRMKQLAHEDLIKLAKENEAAIAKWQEAEERLESAEKRHGGRDDPGETYIPAIEVRSPTFRQDSDDLRPARPGHRSTPSGDSHELGPEGSSHGSHSQIGSVQGTARRDFRRRATMAPLPRLVLGDEDGSGFTVGLEPSNVQPMQSPRLRRASVFPSDYTLGMPAENNAPGRPLSRYATSSRRGVSVGAPAIATDGMELLRKEVERLESLARGKNDEYNEALLQYQRMSEPAYQEHVDATLAQAVRAMNRARLNAPKSPQTCLVAGQAAMVAASQVSLDSCGIAASTASLAALSNAKWENAEIAGLAAARWHDGFVTETDIIKNLAKAAGVVAIAANAASSATDSFKSGGRDRADRFKVVAAASEALAKTADEAAQGSTDAKEKRTQADNDKIKADEFEEDAKSAENIDAAVKKAVGDTDTAKGAAAACWDLEAAIAALMTTIDAAEEAARPIRDIGAQDVEAAIQKAVSRAKALIDKVRDAHNKARSAATASEDIAKAYAEAKLAREAADAEMAYLSTAAQSAAKAAAAFNLPRLEIPAEIPDSDEDVAPDVARPLQTRRELQQASLDQAEQDASNALEAVDKNVNSARQDEYNTRSGLIRAALAADAISGETLPATFNHGVAATAHILNHPNRAPNREHNAAVLLLATLDARPTVAPVTPPTRSSTFALAPPAPGKKRAIGQERQVAYEAVFREEALIPPGYTVKTVDYLAGHQARPVEHLDHAKIREREISQENEDGTKTKKVEHLIEMEVDGANAFVPCIWEGATDQMSASVLLKPAKAEGVALGSEMLLLVGFNALRGGATSRGAWTTVQQRSGDINQMLEAVEFELNHLATLRDSDFVFGKSREYKFHGSPVADEQLNILLKQVELDLSYYVRGRFSSTAYKHKMLAHEAHLIDLAQRDRDRKKNQKFRKLEWYIRMLLTLTAVGLTSGRLEVGD